MTQNTLNSNAHRISIRLNVHLSCTRFFFSENHRENFQNCYQTPDLSLTNIQIWPLIWPDLNFSFYLWLFWIFLTEFYAVKLSNVLERMISLFILAFFQIWIDFNFYWHSIVNITQIILSNSLEITFSAAKNGISSKKKMKNRIQRYFLSNYSALFGT